MTLKEYLKRLVAFAENHPESLGYDVVYSKDDEGNAFYLVHHLAEIGYFEGHDFYTPDNCDPEDLPLPPNAICIN